MRATLDKFGRIVIPKKVRDTLGLEAGTDLTVDEDPDRGEIVLRPVRGEVELTDKQGVLVASCVADGDLAAAVRKNRERRIERLASGAGS